METSVDKFIAAFNTQGINFIRAAYLADMTYSQYMRHVKDLRLKKVTWIDGLRIKHCEICGQAYIAYYKGFVCKKCKELEKYEKGNSVTPQEKYCAECGKKFLDRSINRRGIFCSEACRKLFNKKREERRVRSRKRRNA